MSSWAAARTAPSDSPPSSGGYRRTRSNVRRLPSIIDANGFEKRAATSAGVFASTHPSRVLAMSVAISA